MLRSKFVGALVTSWLLSAMCLAAPQILSIDMMDTTNTSNANTTEFKTPLVPRLVIRRGQKYYFGITTNKDEPQSHWNIFPSAKRTWDGTGVAILPFAGNPPFPDDNWYFKVSPGAVGFDSQQFLLEIGVPSDAEVGTYELRIDALVTQTVIPTAAIPALAIQKIFPKKTVLLFNAWKSADPVYLSDQKDRDEYIKNQSGIVYTGEGSPFPWAYKQFDELTLNVMNYILDETPWLDRTSAVEVTREISGSTNWRYWSQGIVEGKWGGGFGLGKEPFFWKGTDMVLKEYTKAGPPYTPVKYGQCWVFGAVSTSLLRCVGIPARPVSSYLTAIDNSAPPDGHIDYFYKYNPGPKTYTYAPALKIDSYWNYHVWTEAWMERDDLFGGDGWQVIDATSQAGGPGLKKIGPASRAVIADSATPPTDAYDSAFMWASARADQRELYEDKTTPGVFNVDSIKNNTDSGFAQFVLTKARGAATATDVAADYRPAPRPAPSISPSLTPAGSGSVLSNPYFSVQFSSSNTAAAGQDVTATVTITNTSGTSLTFYSTFGAALHCYNGDLVTVLADPTWDPVTLLPGQGTPLTLTIPGASITPFLSPTDEYVRFFGAVNCDEVNTAVGIWPTDGGGGVGIAGPPVTLSLSPPSPITVGGSTGAVASYVNTTGLTLTGVTAQFGVGTGLSIGGESNLALSLPDIGPGASAAIPVVSVTGATIGSAPVSITMLSDQLPASTAMVWLAVTSCTGDFNGDGLVDDNDFVIFTSGYDAYSCTSPEMDLGCPADLNGDQVVDDVDFTIFVAAYELLYCP